MEYLLILALGGWLGWEAHPEPEACRATPLVTTECGPIAQLEDNTFGGTTTKLIDLAGQYKKCRAACTGGN